MSSGLRKPGSTHVTGTDTKASAPMAIASRRSSRTAFVARVMQPDSHGKSWDITSCDLSDLQKHKNEGLKLILIPWMPEMNKSGDEQLYNTVTRQFNPPVELWEEQLMKSNGYHWIVNGTPSDDRQVHCMRFATKQLNPRGLGNTIDYKWHDMTFCCILNKAKSMTMLAFNIPAMLWPMFENLPLENLTFDVSGLVAVQLEIVRTAVKLYDDSLWSVRDSIRTIEEVRHFTQLTLKRRNQYLENDPNFSALHELARHALHVKETLTVAIDTVAAVAELTKHTDVILMARSEHDLTHHQRRLRAILNRADATKDRVHNEINLDSRANIALSKAAMTESRSMRQIAVLTLLFLPATFISAIFSTSFFQFGSDSSSWSVSSKFWVYWVVTIPLTILSFLLWHMQGARRISTTA